MASREVSQGTKAFGEQLLMLLFLYGLTVFVVAATLAVDKAIFLVFGGW